MPKWPPQHQLQPDSDSEEEEINYIDRAKELIAKRRGLNPREKIKSQQFGF